MKPFKSKQNSSSVVLCHLPHSSTYIPTKEKDSFVLKGKELEIETLKMADLYTEALFRPLCRLTSFHIASISRVVVDVERFTDDAKESMSGFGMGAVYTRTSSGTMLRNMTKKEKNRVIRSYFTPYHDALSNHVESIIKRHGSCLIIDCHSFPDKPRGYEPSQKIPRPDICIGVDRYHTPKKLWQRLAIAFQRAGYSVQINDPFAGSLVPLKFYRRNKKVHSIMIEVNRKLYMSESTFRKRKNFTAISNEICDIARENLSLNK